METKNHNTHFIICILFILYDVINIIQTRKVQNDILEVLNEKKLQLRIKYPMKLSYRLEGGIKTFSDKHELAAFVIIKLSVMLVLGPDQQEKFRKKQQEPGVQQTVSPSIQQQSSSISLAGMTGAESPSPPSTSERDFFISSRPTAPLAAVTRGRASGN